jgi:hypothetical protein
VEALSDASEAASKLRSAWKAFVAGGVDESTLLSDLEAVMSFAESAKAALP